MPVKDEACRLSFKKLWSGLLRVIGMALGIGYCISLTRVLL